MSDLTHPTRAAPAERYLGLASVVAGAAGLVAICGSPLALWSYAADLGSAVWSLAQALVG